MLRKKGRREEGKEILLNIFELSRFHSSRPFPIT
jgi:hypothetical protein